MHEFIDQIINKAQSNPKTIVLAEGTDLRVIEAASIIIQKKIAKLILLGNPKDVTSMATENNIDISEVKIINPEDTEYSSKLSQTLYDIRKNKGLTQNEADKLIKDPLYFGTMLVQTGMADGMVAGSNCPTANVLKPALQIVKAAPNQKIVSTFFMIISPDHQFGENGLLFFADCSLNLNPNPEELANIAAQTADSFKFFVNSQPKVAMLSFSTNGSGYGDMVTKVQDATKIVKTNRPDLLIEGEIQADAAIVPHVSKQKHPESVIEGNANILIFPDLNTGNISYKLVQRLAKAEAFGPITQGMNKPINDLSRGCTAQDIVITTAITVIQSQSQLNLNSTKSAVLLNESANL